MRVKRRLVESSNMAMMAMTESENMAMIRGMGPELRRTNAPANIRKYKHFTMIN